MRLWCKRLAHYRGVLYAICTPGVRCEQERRLALAQTSNAVDATSPPDPMGTDKRRRAVVSTMQPKTKDDSVRMTAKALITTTTEPGRAHAVDLVLLGHLLASRLKRECSVDSESNFARVWRDHVVPVAAASRSDWQVGMCAEITADLATSTGVSFKNVVGRVSGTARTLRPAILLIGRPDRAVRDCPRFGRSRAGLLTASGGRCSFRAQTASARST